MQNKLTINQKLGIYLAAYLLAFFALLLIEEIPAGIAALGIGLVIAILATNTQKGQEIALKFISQIPQKETK